MVSDLVCASDVQAHTAAVKVLLRELVSAEALAKVEHD